jgi:hypothetical protein
VLDFNQSSNTNATYFWNRATPVQAFGVPDVTGTTESKSISKLIERDEARLYMG